MRARRAPARGTGALLLLCLLLAGAVALEIRNPDKLVLLVGLPPGGTLITQGAGAGGESEPGPYQPPGETAFEVIENRPLFAPDRRPPEAGSPAAANSPATPAALDGLVLTGIIGAGEDRIAIVEPAGPPRPGAESLSLRVGGELRGWTVEAIEADRILLVTGTQKYYMTLVDDPARRRRGKRRKPPAPAGSLRTPNVLTPQPAPQSQLLQPAPQPKPKTER